MPEDILVRLSTALPTADGRTLSTLKAYNNNQKVINLLDFGSGVGTGSSDTASYLAWMAAVNAMPGCQSLMPQAPGGSYTLECKIGFQVTGHNFMTHGQGNTIVNFEPDTAAYDAGIGTVKAVAGQLQFLTRYQQMNLLHNYNRIAVGSDHYLLTSCADAVGTTPLDGVTLTRVGNVVTFHFGGSVTSMAKYIENGSSISVFDGVHDAGYTVSLFNGTDSCTLLKTGSGANADFNASATCHPNYFTATLTALNGGATTFDPHSFVIPHTAAFEWRLPNLTPWTSFASLISDVRVHGFTLQSTDTINQKIPVDLWDQSDCTVARVRAKNLTGTGALGGVGPTNYTPSMLLRTTGREKLDAYGNVGVADQPIFLRQLIYAPNTSIDVYRIRRNDLQPLIATNNGILIEYGAGAKKIIIDSNNTELGVGLVRHEGGPNQVLNPTISRNSSEQFQSAVMADGTTAAAVIDWNAPGLELDIDANDLGGVVNEDTPTGIRARGVVGTNIRATTYYGGGLKTYTAGAFVVGGTYTIVTVGTTSFTAIGAASNTPGVSFTATGVGSGTGTATDNNTFRCALDVDDTCEDINLDDYRAATGSTTNLKTYHEPSDEKPMIDSGAPFAPKSFWHRIAAANGRAIRLNNVSMENKDVLLNYGEVYQFALSISGAAKHAPFFVSGHSSPHSFAYTTGSITSSGTAATFHCVAHGVPIGATVRFTIAGATPSGYNGTWDGTASDADHITFTLGGSLTSPATGSITAGTPEFLCSMIGVWATPAGVHAIGTPYGPIQYDNTTPDWALCLQWGVGGNNLQILNAQHWPPVSVIAHSLFSVNG